MKKTFIWSVIFKITALFQVQSTINQGLKLSNKIKRSIKSTLSVHVLSVLSLQNYMNSSNFVAFNLLPLCGVKRTEAHGLQHLLFIWSLPSKVSI